MSFIFPSVLFATCLSDFLEVWKLQIGQKGRELTRRLANLVATWSVGSIDSLAPARSPFGLRLCRAAPAGSIPAGDILRYARSWVT